MGNEHDQQRLASNECEVPAHACALAIMAKAPRVGAVKTRLVPPLSPAEAAELSRCFIRDVTGNIAELMSDARVRGVVAYTPFGMEDAFDGLLPGGFRLLAQRGDDLGERLRHAGEDLFAAGFEAICLINSDSPTMPTSLLEEAVASLQAPGERVVLGAAADGGYYLIGLKRAYGHLFHAIDWSTERVFGQTLERAADLGLTVDRLPVWYDVDDAASLRDLCKDLFSGTLPPACNGLSGYGAPATSRFLRQLLAVDGTGKRLGLRLHLS